MDNGAQNEQWAHQLINALLAQGIDYFCGGPGSRSTPLALAIARLNEDLYSVHFDERGVCFHALGYAKASGKPAVVFATSGTAIGNLLPAVMEAYNDHIPLILLTADRPPELRDCGANQTCNQVRLFANHVRWQIDLPCPDERIPKNYLSSTISHAVALSQSSPAGPVHINCMFREPLFSLNETPNSSPKCIAFAHPELHPSEAVIAHFAKELALPKKGVIVAGSNTSDQTEAIFALAERLKWPLFADILSTPRTFEDHPALITHSDPILKCKNTVAAEAIIQFGDRFVSKTLGLWLEAQKPAFYLHISKHQERQDPAHLATHRVHASPALFVEKLLAALPAQKVDTWQKQWKTWDLACQKALSDFFSAENTLTEPNLIPHIASHLCPDWTLFLASSMPIRDANQFFLPTSRSGPIFGNRGVSGIDGNIATAAGIAQGSKKPTLTLLGDLAFLHDLNSLAYLSKIDYPLVLCVVNNGGGGIFSFLPISKKKASFETFFAAAHSYSFASAATLFDLPYHHPESTLELKTLLQDQRKRPHPCIIEITTDRAQNVLIHEQIQTAIRTCLASAESPEAIPAFLH